MERNLCSACNAAVLSSDSLFCHKCGARIEASVEKTNTQSPVSAVLKNGGAAGGEKNEEEENSKIENKKISDSENAAGSGGVSIKSAPPPDWSFRSFWLEFQRNYYRVPFTASVVIMFAAIAYAISPLDFVSGAPLISWIDDALILACASVNLLHCGVDISKHSENVTFQRIKLMMIPLSAVVIFFMWFCVNIVLILFQKRAL
jgi:uncharacterized membrane protein YkvA (DUF1232 family)